MMRLKILHDPTDTIVNEDVKTFSETMRKCFHLSFSHLRGRKTKFAFNIFAQFANP